jgi:hypothetical protein
MENLESRLVARALAFCNGNQVHTAKLLGITRNVLRTYLKRFGLLSSSSGTARSSRPPSVVPTIRSPPAFARHPLHYPDAVRGELA